MPSTSSRTTSSTRRRTATPPPTTSTTSSGILRSPRTASPCSCPLASRPGSSTSARTPSRRAGPSGRPRARPRLAVADRLAFEILPATSGAAARGAAPAARRGRLTTPHGGVETPAFMPVGTLGAVKGVTPQELSAAGASMLLANLYHLALRPGIDTIERLGGLHRFVGWSGPLLTDSGGFQVWSLGHLRTVDDGGVTFRSHLDGSSWRFTPEAVVEWQERLGGGGPRERGESP